MSFALEYRKKMQTDARKKRAKKKAVSKVDAEFAVAAARKSTDTRNNRRCVLAALSLAGIILSVFNSNALVNYAGGLGYNAVTMRVITWAEDWHRLMEDNSMTMVVEEIRGAVTMARQSSWQDLAFGMSVKPAHPYLQGPDETVPPDDTRPVESVPAGTEPEQAPAAPAGPVLRAAISPPPGQ